MRKYRVYLPDGRSSFFVVHSCATGDLWIYIDHLMVPVQSIPGCPYFEVNQSFCYKHLSRHDLSQFRA